MNRLLYEKSVSYKGHLIIPFVFGLISGNQIYSYTLLSELGSKDKFHKAENPASIYSDSLADIIKTAKSHIDENYDSVSDEDYFKCRYTYRHELIIIYQVAEQYFYDHYQPESLNNIAAPRLFTSEQECINWVKQGLDRSYADEETEKV